MATSQPGLPESEMEGLLQRKNELDEGGRKVREGRGGKGEGREGGGGHYNYMHVGERRR